MAVLTFGDVLQQCQDITGIRDGEDAAMRVLKAGINTGHTKVVLAAIAEGLPWMLRLGCPLSVSATATNVVLPDGSTVTDANGAIPVKCTTVTAARLDSTARSLTWRPKDVFEAQYGRLESLGRGTPQYYCPYGYDSSGRQLLWLMPLPGAADTLYVDYVGGLTYLTNVAQQLVPPEDFREVVCQEAIANVNARDTIDQALVVQARQTANYLWRCVMAASRQSGQRYRTVPQIHGQTE